ncbi:signal peptidase I [Streptohalobacillus salinus]|uniref:Signal peptidase I n=1 Tax=Streptohalobacillus salinus TaxID=621096 RepID=A0A2V3W4F8_9BACI|nr:signal peptidase I [Streptohalobacillus salinus]PXW89223.1 signal peptidase I [Streptohalobacillus salinus]
MIEEIISWLKAIVIALLIVVVVRGVLMTPSIVKGDSMDPNLQDGDRIIISKIHDIDRFDEIAFIAPDKDENYVKRVIGLPGDHIKIEDDVLYINNTPYVEVYLDDKKEGYGSDQLFTGNYSLDGVVPEDSFFVLGDNRPISRDSRSFGVIDASSVIGEVVFRIWPLENIGIIN